MLQEMQYDEGCYIYFDRSTLLQRISDVHSPKLAVVFFVHKRKVRCVLSLSVQSISMDKKALKIFPNLFLIQVTGT